jgi:hypothetical protein
MTGEASETTGVLTRRRLGLPTQGPVSAAIWVPLAMLSISIEVSS